MTTNDRFQTSKEVFDDLAREYAEQRDEVNARWLKALDDLRESYDKLITELHNRVDEALFAESTVYQNARKKLIHQNLPHNEYLTKMLVAWVDLQPTRMRFHKELQKLLDDFTKKQDQLSNERDNAWLQARIDYNRKCKELSEQQGLI